MTLDGEALAPGSPCTIRISWTERFVDERPATLVRSVVEDEGRTLYVRDETNGVMHGFCERVLGAPFSENVGPAPMKSSVVALGERTDRVTFADRARIQSCDMCGEPDVIGVIAHARGRCGRCIKPVDCVWVPGGPAPADADWARALVRYERAIEDHESMKRALDELDGLAPWHVLCEPFAAVGDRLWLRSLLLGKQWAGELVPGAVVDIRTMPQEHPWLVRIAPGAIVFRFVVTEATIVAANGDVVAVRP